MTAKFRMVVTGATGQVARALVDIGPSQGVEVVAVGRPDIDLADPGTLMPAIGAQRPDVVVNAAAHSRPEQADREPEMADAINAAGAGALAACARQLGIPIIQLSTAYVFDGTQSAPYRESDPPAPIGVYGRSKLAGERAVAAAHPQHVILRLSWVFGPFGRNLATALLDQARTMSDVRVVADQIGSPAAVEDTAGGIIAVTRNLLRGADGPDAFGVFHMSGPEPVTPTAFATALFSVSADCGGPAARVVPIPSAEYSTHVRRPPNVSLDSARIAAIHGVALPPWRGALRACIERILEKRT